MVLKFSEHIEWKVATETVILIDLEQLLWNCYDLRTKQKHFEGNLKRQNTFIVNDFSKAEEKLDGRGKKTKGTR